MSGPWCWTKLSVAESVTSLQNAAVSAAVSAACLLCPPRSLRHGGCLIEKIISLNTNIFYHDLIYWKTPSFDREKNHSNWVKCVLLCVSTVNYLDFCDEYLFTLIHLFPSGV